MLIKTEDGLENVEDLRKVTADNFIVPEGEESYYHCLIENEQWEKGNKISHPDLQTFEKRFFETTGLHDLKQLGYEVTILHEAEDFRKVQARKEEAEKDAIRNAAIKAAKNELLKDESFKAELLAQAKAELKAEIMRSTAAEGDAPTNGKAEDEKPGRTKKSEK